MVNLYVLHIYGVLIYSDSVSFGFPLHPSLTNIL